MPYRRLLAAASVLALAGCGQAPTATQAPRGVRGPAELVAEADARLAAGNWAAAAEAYQAVLALDRDDVRARYRLGVAYSGLGRPDDAAREFLAVLERAAPESDEAKLARQWLVEAGRLPAAPAAGAPSARVPDGPASGALGGRTEWPNPVPDLQPPRLQILLVGLEDEAGSRRYATRVRLGEPYRFEGLAPGRYRLLARAGGELLWDLEVAVPESGQAALDLTRANAAVK